jgi:MoaA/NifB/PqqE/SkfB family radical SAM enzyme
VGKEAALGSGAVGSRRDPVDLVAANRRLNTEEVRAGRVRLESAPLQVNVELTGVCNIDPPCVFCTGKNFGHNYRPLDTAYLDKHRSFLERCERVNEDSFGEPLSHPALVATARRFTANGQNFSFVTNGLLLTRAKADALAALGPRLGMHVSLNAASGDTFYRLTGKSFDRVVENVRYYVEAYAARNAGAAPDMILTFIVMKINRHEVAPFLRLARDLRGRALLASLHDRPSIPLGHFGYDFVYEDEMLPYPELVQVGREAAALAAELGVKCGLQWDAARDSTIRGFAEPGVATPCLVPWRFLFVQEHSGKVFGCPYHRQPYADLKGQSLEEVWNGAPAQALRASLVGGKVPKYCLDNGAGCPLVMAALQDRAEDAVEESVEVGRNDFTHLVSGWHPLEHLPDPIRWTSEASEFLIRTTGDGTLCIDANAWTRDSVCVEVEMDGRRLGRARVRDYGWQTLRFRLPDRSPAVRRGRIVTADPWMPAQPGTGGDTRRLGIAVRRIWTEPVYRQQVADRLARGVRQTFGFAAGR